MRVMRFFPKAAFDIDNILKDWLEKSGSGQGPQVAAFEYPVNQRRRGASLLLGLRNRHFCPKVQTGGRTPNREGEPEIVVFDDGACDRRRKKI